MEILDSALKHGIDPDDSVFVVEHPWQCFLLREEPRKVLFLGFSPSGKPLEVIVAETTCYGDAVIHAMPMRKKYWNSLEKGI